MSISLTRQQTRLLRLKAQRLYPPGSTSSVSPDQLLREVMAIQAQDLSAAQLSLRARSTGLTAAAVQHALQREHAIAWTWCMRGTMHLINARDAGWLIPLFGPVFIAADERRFRQLGWDEKKASIGLRLVKDALAERGEISRPQIASLLEENKLPYQGQATIHLIKRAGLEGILCMGVDGQGNPTYAPYEHWIGDLQPLTTQDALAELGLRYLQAYGPATPEDLASWSGLKISTAREAWQLIAQQLVEVDVAGSPAWMPEKHLAWLDELLAEPHPTPASSNISVRLLPKFDTYLLGYASRELVVEKKYARHVHPGGGLIYPVLLLGGRALGTWKTKRSRDHLEIAVTPFKSLSDELVPLVAAEVEDIGRFLGNEALLTLGAPLPT